MASPIVAAPSTTVQSTVRSEGRWRRIVGGLGGLAILLALATRIDVLALLAFTVAGILLIGVAAFLGEPRRLARFVVVNLLLTALLAWGLAERDELNVLVDGNRVEAQTGGIRLVGTAGFSTTQSVGVSLSAAEERPAVARWAYQPRSWLEEIGLWLSTNVRSGVSDVAVTLPDGSPLLPSTPTLWQPLRDGGPPTTSGSLAVWEVGRDRDGDVELVAPNVGQSAFRVLMSLIRPGPDVQVVLRPPTGNPVAVRAAPDRRTLELVELIGDLDERPLVGGLFVYRRSAAAWTQTLIRELSRPWLFALAFLGLAQLLAVRLPAAFLGDAVPFTRSQAFVMAASFGAAALMLAALVASFVLERLPHVQDSVTYLFQAEVTARGWLWAPAPAMPEFFEQEFVLARDERWFGKYTPGWPLVLALGVLAGAPWLVSPVLAALATGLTYLAGRRMYGGGVAALAAILMLFSPFFLIMSGEMMAHSAGLFWTALLLYATVVCWQRGHALAWLLAGVAFGMLFITRQLTALGVGAAPLLIVALAGLRMPRRLPLYAALFLVGAAPPLAYLAYFNTEFTGSPLGSTYELWWDFDRVGFGPTVGMHGGHDLANGLSNTFANLQELLRHLHGWPAYLTLAPALVPLAYASRKLWDWVLLGSAAGLMLAYVFYWADGIMYGPRYYYESLTALVLLTARGCALVADLPARLQLRRSRVDESGQATTGPNGEAARPTWFQSARPAVLVLLVGLIAGNVLGYLPVIVGSSRGYNGVSRARLNVVEEAGLGSALVFVRQDWPDWQPYGSVFPANGPLLDNSIVYARDLGPVENRRLMAEYPDRDAYLLEGLELTEIRP